MSLLDPYDAVLLDLNGTCMFGGDRLGEGEDFAATYRAVGGSRLASWQVAAAIRACFDALAADYEDPARYDDFPGVAEALRRADPDLDEEEVGRLARVFGLHEVGRVPDGHAAILRRLARRHRLGLVANIWAEKLPWLVELERAGVLGLFGVTVFSSDSRSIKPSPVLFRRALDALGVAAARAVFVGDSLRCDIAGARAAGLATVWITESGHPSDADHRVGGLLDLGDS